MFDFEQARQNMVECQICTVKVTDASVLAAMRNVTREAFLPAQLKSIAYVDEDLRINEERLTDDGGVGKAVLMRRSGDAVGTRVLFDAQVPRLKAFDRAPAFQF